MTRERAKELMPIIQAFSDGKDVEWYNPTDKSWASCTSTAAFADELEYRIKPEPKLRPWKACEVPAGAIIRDIGSDSGWSAICGVREGGNSAGIWIVDGISNNCITSFYSAFTKLEHSIDGGKTWLPCGVMEDAK